MKTNLLQWTLNGIGQPLAQFTSPADIRDIIINIDKLPVLSGIATRLLELSTDPLADAEKLSSIIELDPNLTAQVLRWANSPLYGKRGKIDSVQQAIHRVLGFEYVLNAALSLIALKPLPLPKHGPLGSKQLWIQALMSVQLMSLLSKRMPTTIRPRAHEIFLVALIHNIGFSLLALYFANEFNYLNKIISNNANLAIFELENFAFNIDHGLLGTWLLRSWNMPPAVVEVIYQHHNPNYQGEYCYLNQLTFLNDCLLGEIGIGDAQNQSCPHAIYASLQLDPAECKSLVAQLQERFDDINATADELCA